MSEYPRDQFDDVPEYRDRTGSHRSGPTSDGSGPSGLTWISVAAALALIVGAFSYFVLPTLRAGGADGPAGADGSRGAGAAVIAPATATATPDAGLQPENGASAPGGESAEPGPTSSATEVPSATGSDATGSQQPTVSAQPTQSPVATATPEPAATPAPTDSPEPTESNQPTETEEPSTVDYSFPVEVYNASRVNGLAARASGALAGAGFTVATAGNWSGFPVSSSAVFYSSDEATAQAVAARFGLPAVYDGRVPGIAVVLTSG